MQIKEFITKLQNLPLNQRKIILWVIVAMLALGLGFLWFKITMTRFSKIENSVKKIDIPSVENK
ncbi:MAG: hypothetical protein Q7S77_02075 [Candidatus Staskawiczbacteria bacterium]|nr:hypothetical protein [Candidatus Staskawiczbacteria bacterium]